MLVSVENLSKKYSRKSDYAIMDITLHGDAGEIVGILGHNGAGKSTTIKCITGMHPYESGTVTICGHDLAKEPLLAKNASGMFLTNLRLLKK